MNKPAETPNRLTRGWPTEDSDVWHLIPPERSSLLRLKRLSLRNKSWFTLLSRTERKFIDAVTITVDKIRSLMVLRLLSPLVRRLLETLRRDLNVALSLTGLGAYKMMKDVAERIVGTAQKWGNKSAKEWLDHGFLRYLAVISLPQNKNLPPAACWHTSSLLGPKDW